MRVSFFSVVADVRFLGACHPHFKSPGVKVELLSERSSNPKTRQLVNPKPGLYPSHGIKVTTGIVGISGLLGSKTVLEEEYFCSFLEFGFAFTCSEVVLKLQKAFA